MAEQKKLVSLVAFTTAMTSLVTKVKNWVTEQLPGAATAQKAGIVKIGSGVNVTEDGTISVEVPTKVSDLTNDSGFQTADQVTATAKAEVAGLVNGAPETFDTLKEIADYIEAHETVVDALNAAIGAKANAEDVYSKDEIDAMYMTAAEAEAIVEAAFA